MSWGSSTGEGGGGNSKKVNNHLKIPEIDLDFFRLLSKLSKFKTTLRCIGGIHMVKHDEFKTIVTHLNEKNSKKF